MSAALNTRDRKMLTLLADKDVVAGWDNAALKALAGRDLVESRLLFQPTGRLSRSKLWAITAAGRAALGAAA